MVLVEERISTRLRESVNMVKFIILFDYIKLTNLRRVSVSPVKTEVNPSILKKRWI